MRNTLEAADPPLLDVRGLSVHYPARGRAFSRAISVIRAVDDVSFAIRRGQTLGIVGESGSGKTTVGRAILRLAPVAAGRIRFDGHDVLSLRGGALRRLRRGMQIIFQDPAGSLDPRMRIGPIIGEPLLVHGLARGAALRRSVDELLVTCGLWPEAARRFPHEFSGGQRQRIAIARALALNPALLICDEPTSALDVSIQAQILNLLKDLQRDRDLTYLFISHDIAVVNHMCDRIAVMKDGRIVEIGEREQVMQDPQHEYTRQLLAAVPTIDHAFSGGTISLPR
jgi:ABC-type glutathione transport system ATPase component